MTLQARLAKNTTIGTTSSGLITCKSRDLGNDLVGDAGVGALAVHGRTDIVDHHRGTAAGQLQRVQPAEPPGRHP